MISEQYANCLGKLCGDGNVSANYLRYNNTCQALLDEFERNVKSIFGDIHLIKGKVNSGTSFIQIQRKDVLSSFKEQLESFKSDDIRIPSSVKKSSLKVKIAFIRAFYDDEGCANFRFFSKTNEWKRNISLSSNSICILREIEEILDSLGIKTGKIYRNRPLSSYDKSYVLNITGKNNYVIFRDKIGFNHPKKIVSLNLIIDSYNATPKRNPIKFKKIKEKMDLS